MKTKRIHIVGPPRSGTTLMHVLLSTCMGVDGISKHEERIWRRMPDGERILVTKFPGEESFARSLLKYDHDLWFVFMLRDPRDLIVSQHGNKPGHYWSNLHIWYDALDTLEAMHTHPRFVVVRYENLVNSPDTVQQELVQRMPFLSTNIPFTKYQSHLPQNIAQSDAIQKAMMGIRSITPQSLGTWRLHLPRIKSQIQLFPDLPAKLVKLGYEKNENWLGQLKSVDLDTSPDLIGYVLEAFRLWRRRLHYQSRIPLYVIRHRRQIKLSPISVEPAISKKGM